MSAFASHYQYRLIANSHQQPNLSLYQAWHISIKVCVTLNQLTNLGQYFHRSEGFSLEDFTLIG